MFYISHLPQGLFLLKRVFLKLCHSHIASVSVGVSHSKWTEMKCREYRTIIKKNKISVFVCRYSIMNETRAQVSRALNLLRVQLAQFKIQRVDG